MEKQQYKHLKRGGQVSNCLTSVAKDSYILCPQRTEEEKRRRHLEGDKGAKFSKGKQWMPRTDGCSNTITTIQKDNMLMEKKTTAKADTDKRPAKPKKKGLWFWREEIKKWIRYRIRKLTERECFRLMDVDDEYIDKIQAAGISGSQQYKLAGNSIVVNCMSLIFENLFINNEKPEGFLF